MDDIKIPDEPALAALQEWFNVPRYAQFHPDIVARMERTLAAARAAQPVAAKAETHALEVEVVDAVLGYSIENSGDPERQRALYQLVGERIRSALSSPVGGAEEIKELQEQLRAAKWANERDRSTVCDQVNIIKDEIARRSWLCSSRGSYEWDDERYQQEFSAAPEIIGKAVEKLSSIASDWSHWPETDAEIQAARASSPAPASDAAFERSFAIGDRVRKVKGSSWQGKVIGFYSTDLTPVGYCIESEREPGSVQIYPEGALEPVSSGMEA